MHYRLAGMSVDVWMVVGMVLILLGLAATVYGLFPRPGPSPTSAWPGSGFGLSTTPASSPPTWGCCWSWPRRSPSTS